MARMIRRVIAVAVTVLALLGAIRLVVRHRRGAAGVDVSWRFCGPRWTTAPASGPSDLFPGGYFFLHVLYGLSWVELGLGPASAQRGVPGSPVALGRLDSTAGADLQQAVLTRRTACSTEAGRTGCAAGCWACSRPMTGPRRGAAVRRRLGSARRRVRRLGRALPDGVPGSGLAGRLHGGDGVVAAARLRCCAAVRRRPSIGGCASVRERLDPRTGLLPAPGRSRVRRTRSEVARGTFPERHPSLPLEIDPVFARRAIPALS